MSKDGWKDFSGSYVLSDNAFLCISMYTTKISFWKKSDAEREKKARNSGAQLSPSFRTFLPNQTPVGST